MGFIELLILGAALGTDAFSVSVAVGTRRLEWTVVIKLSLLIGGLHILMPLIGINLGRIVHLFFEQYYFQATIDGISRAIGAGILMIMGMIMIHDNLVNKGESRYQSGLYGASVIILALSVSIDALSAGFSLSMLEAKMLGGCILLGGIVSIMVLGGLFLGNKLGNIIDRAEILGGIALILLGIKFILSL